jgi:hypothetical protein
LNFNLGNPALEPVEEQQRVDEWQAAIESARRCLERAKESQKFYADAKRCERVFKVGDKVLLSLQNINVRHYESNRKHEQGRVGGLERHLLRTYANEIAVPHVPMFELHPDDPLA